MNRTRLTTINLYAGAIRLAAFASALTAVEPEPPTTDTHNDHRRVVHRETHYCEGESGERYNHRHA